MQIPRLPPRPSKRRRILIEYRGGWGLGDRLCSEPLIRGLFERHGPDVEIRYHGDPGNAGFSPCFTGPADDEFEPDLTVQIDLFDRMTLEQYAVREAMPSLVDHMCSYGGVYPKDRTPRLNLGEDEQWLIEQMDLDRLPRPLVAICADSSDPYRGWPVERHRAVAEHAQRRGATVIEIGTNAKLGVGIDLVDALPIRGTAAVLSQCDLFIGNNSGPFHYAQAAGVPAIVFFSLAMPERFIHDGRMVVPVQRDDLACIDCMTRDFAGRNRSGCTNEIDAACIQGLPVEAGLEALDRVFDEYLIDCPTRGEEGPTARAFRARLCMEQAQRLLERGHGPRAARFLDQAARLCRFVEPAQLEPSSPTR